MKIITRTDARSAGLKRYWTGEKCHQGHLAERRISDHGCTECSRLKAASPKERDRRREYMAAHQRRYRKAHPDRVRATKMKHGHELLAAYKRALRAKDPERYRLALRKSFQKHKAKRMAEHKEWVRKNKDAWRRHMRPIKIMRRAAEGRFDSADVARMLAEQGSRTLRRWRSGSLGRRRFKRRHWRGFWRSRSRNIWNRDPHKMMLAILKQRCYLVRIGDHLARDVFAEGVDANEMIIHGTFPSRLVRWHSLRGRELPC
jgi:hypothetical protein